MQKSEKRIIDLTVGELHQLIIEAVAQHSSTVTPQEIQDIIPIEIAMEITSLAKQTIYGKVFNREIPYIKAPNSRKLMFSRKALNEWMMEGEMK